MEKNNCFCFSKNKKIFSPRYSMYQLKYIINQNNNTYSEFCNNVDMSYFMPYIKYSGCIFTSDIMKVYKEKQNMYDVKNEN